MDYTHRGMPWADTFKQLLMSGWFGENSGTTTRAVGQKIPNGRGLYDMLGNVSEWCAELHEHDELIDPLKPPRRVSLGGDWVCPAPVQVIAPRRNNNALDRFFNLGFRVVRDLSPK